MLFAQQYMGKLRMYLGLLGRRHNHKDKRDTIRPKNTAIVADRLYMCIDVRVYNMKIMSAFRISMGKIPQPAEENPHPYEEYYPIEHKSVRYIVCIHHRYTPKLFPQWLTYNNLPGNSVRAFPRK